MARSRKRPYGTGNVYVKSGSFYARWRTPDGRRVNRKLGPVRLPGSTIGLTQAQAERQLRRVMAQAPAPPPAELTLEQVAAELLAHLEARGRSRSHIETVESHFRVHLLPFFGGKALTRIAAGDVERLLARVRGQGRAPKTLKNLLSTLHSTLDLAVRRRYIEENPCRFVEPPVIQPSADIRYLTQAELEEVLQRGIPDDAWGVLERPLYLMAAMTGLRQGELLALRWQDLDWLAQRVRVRRAYVRGEFKGPKSRRGARGVPMAQRLAGELEHLSQASEFQADEDLVFAHPETGGPLDRSKVRKRFQRACSRAGVRRVRFHDLRHTFGTRVAASGDVSLRTLQEWMGHRDAKTTLMYADYQPGDREAEIVERAFGS